MNPLEASHPRELLQLTLRGVPEQVRPRAPCFYNFLALTSIQKPGLDRATGGASGARAPTA